MLHMGRFCFLRVQLSFLYLRAFHGSLLSTALSPNESNSSVDVEVSPTCPTVPTAAFAYSSSFYLPSTLASGSLQCIPHQPWEKGRTLVFI